MPFTTRLNRAAGNVGIHECTSEKSKEECLQRAPSGGRACASVARALCRRSRRALRQVAAACCGERQASARTISR